MEFDLQGCDPKCNYPGLSDNEWAFEEHELPNNHVAAVAWQKLGARMASLIKCEIIPNNIYKSEIVPSISIAQLQFADKLMINPFYLQKFVKKEPFEVLSFDLLMETLSPWNEVIEDFWSIYCHKELQPPSARIALS